MSTRLKSSRSEIILTKFSAEGAVMKVHVNMRETFRIEKGNKAMFDAISLTRAQALALGQDLLAFANEMEVADHDWEVADHE